MSEVVNNEQQLQDAKKGAGEPHIIVRGVKKSFGSHVIYDGLDLEVKKGETLTLLGPSGTGKSVLLKLLIGLHKPDEGEILVDNTDIVPMSERELRDVRKKIGMLFQGAALFDAMDVGENVAYPLREFFNWPEDKIAARVQECLASVGLPDVARELPSSLSGGMQKRVGLARALCPGPTTILYDEPTTGLDPANTLRINELIRTLQKTLGTTGIVITHDVASAFAISDRIGLVHHGKLQLIVDIKEAKESPPEMLAKFLQGQEMENKSGG